MTIRPHRAGDSPYLLSLYKEYGQPRASFGPISNITYVIEMEGILVGFGTINFEYRPCPILGHFVIDKMLPKKDRFRAARMLVRFLLGQLPRHFLVDIEAKNLYLNKFLVTFFRTKIKLLSVDKYPEGEHNMYLIDKGV